MSGILNSSDKLTYLQALADDDENQNLIFYLLYGIEKEIYEEYEIDENQSEFEAETHFRSVCDQKRDAVC
jgi:hypothetical protein